MTTIFHEVKRKQKLKREIETNRTKGMPFDEILYADDTILPSEKEKR